MQNWLLIKENMFIAINIQQISNIYWYSVDSWCYHKQCLLSLSGQLWNHWMGPSLGKNEFDKWQHFALKRNWNRKKQTSKCKTNWNIIGYVIFTCNTFSSYSFWVNLLFILWFPLLLHCLWVGFVPCPEDKLMIPDLTTRDTCIDDDFYCISYLVKKMWLLRDFNCLGWSHAKLAFPNQIINHREWIFRGIECFKINSFI